MTQKIGLKIYNMVYAYIDGDNIGLLIEKSFMDNNEKELQKINSNVKSIVNEITEYLIEIDVEIIFSGADGIICKSKNINKASLVEKIRTFSDKITFSIGFGNSLKDAYMALRYAKSNNKNVAFQLVRNKFRKIE